MREKGDAVRVLCKAEGVADGVEDPGEVARASSPRWEKGRPGAGLGETGGAAVGQGLGRDSTGDSGEDSKELEPELVRSLDAEPSGGRSFTLLCRHRTQS